MKRKFYLVPAQWLICFSLGLILVFGSATTVWAQYTTARLGGIISDPSGAVVAEATIAVQDVGTGYSQSTNSTSAGQYLFPTLPVGTYQITVSVPGYTRYVQKGIVLSVGQAATQDVQLQVGKVAEQMVVTANPTMVTTDSATVGQLIDQREISELPLNGRDVQELVFLAPGTTNVTANYCAANCEGGVFPSEQYAKVNGGGANGVNYLLDGVDANDTYINANVPFPNPDAIQEFNLITGNMSASFGNAIGGVVNVVTKSGTDQIHGDLFEFLQNSALDASDYFSGGQVNPLKQNQFGGSVGGPILKNRLFFFGSYQGTRFRTANNGQIASVPNANERTGDFSDLLPGTQLVNPNTGANYSNNQIPVSPVATYILNHIPVPNRPNDQLTFNGGPDAQNTDEYLAKVDFNFRKHHLSVHYFQMNYTDPVFIPPSSNLLQLRGDAEHLVLKNVSVVDMYGISPTFLLSSYFGYNSENGTTLSSAPFSIADAGANMAVPQNLGGGNAAVLNVTVGGEFTLPGTPYGIWNRGDQSLREIATWMKGKHEVQFGGEFLRVRLPMGNQYQESGVFDFENMTGSPLADFELGAVSSFTQGGGLYLNFTGYRESLFVQDDWKANPRLLLSAGLRWDPFFPYTDSDGRVACFVSGAQSQRFPNAPVGMLFGGKNHDPGCPASSIYNNPKNFGPRVGFAYRITENGNTSVRGGAGYYYQAPNTVAFEDVVGVPPFAPIINLASSPGAPWVDVADPYGSQQASNPFPAQFGPVNPGPNATFPSSGISFSQIFDRHFRLPMVLAWNLTVEHGFKQDWMLRVAYVGNSGHHLSGTGDQESGLLQLNPSHWDATLQQEVPVYPLYGSIASINSGVDSNYNAAQITLEKRMTHGFSFLTNFTWSRELNDFAPAGGSPYLTNSCSCGRYFDYGPSDDDLSKTFKINGEYMVPHVGLPKAIDKIVNGWGLSGTVSWQTGFPFSIFSGADNSLSGMLGDRADLAVSSVQQSILGGGRSHAAQVAEWFNTSAFQQNATGTFGDTGKNILRGPRFFDTDLAALKNVKISERLSMEFRAEFFNAFNNVNFGRPDGNLADIGTTYGEITGLAGGSSSNTYGTAQPRIIQFAVKLSF
ncbi:MAG: TonB-dependent receptor [Candidatus Sulfotelmatobacter sp.]|jgi:outer membrane receptor protein involved in Fe transport